MVARLSRPRKRTVEAIATSLVLSIIGHSVLAQVRSKIEIVPQILHSDTVRPVAFSPDGKRILSGSNDKTIKLWDIATGHLIRTFETHACGGVSSAEFSPDGTRVLSGGYGSFTESGTSACPGSRDENVKLWDAATGQLLRSFDNDSGWVYSAAFSPNGAYVLSYSESLKLWDTNTGQLLRTFSGRSPIAFSRDGARLLSGGADNAIRLWEVATGELLRTYKGASGTRSVAFSADGTQVLSIGKATVTIWDAASGVRLRHIEVRHSAEVDCCVVALSPDGTRVLSNGEYTDPTIKLWDVASGSLVHSFEGRAGAVSSVSISPDHKSILSGNWRDETVKLWDVGTGRLVHSFKGHPGGVGSVDISPDGARIVSVVFSPVRSICGRMVETSLEAVVCAEPHCC
jgi:WD40 repeat protein